MIPTAAGEHDVVKPPLEIARTCLFEFGTEVGGCIVHGVLLHISKHQSEGLGLVLTKALRTSKVQILCKHDKRYSKR